MCLDLEWINTIKKNNYINKFIKEKNISDKILEFYRREIDSYLMNQTCVIDKKLTPECLQFKKGMIYKISFINNKIVGSYIACPHTIKKSSEYKAIKNYLYYDFDKEDLKLNIRNAKDWKVSKNDLHRLNATKKLADIIKNKTTKGIYLCGASGIGKTHLLKLTANRIAENNKTIVFIDTPSLIIKAQESFNNKSTDYMKLICDIKNCDALFLDDFGGEQISAWSRDSIIFPILNFRLNKRKITFFSSNYPIEFLTNKYSKEPGKYGEINATRIVDRVFGLATPFVLKGDSWRKK